MKVVYIAHPLGSNRTIRELNRERASRWLAWAAEQGVAPVADWIILSGQWTESDANRARGLEIDKALVARCDELWLVGGRVSEGMKVEADAARASGVEVIDMTDLGDEPP